MQQSVSDIQPINLSQQQDVIEETQRYIALAASLFNIKVKPIEIRFDLKGRASGMYRSNRSKKEIRFNPYIFSKYFDDNFATTIPHEVAHYISDIIYGLKNIKPHGNEWQTIMQAFNADASVTTRYDLTGIPVKKQKRFNYECSCKQHQITSVRHNRVQKKQARYFCKQCKQVIQFKKETSIAA